MILKMNAFARATFSDKYNRWSWLNKFYHEKFIGLKMTPLCFEVLIIKQFYGKSCVIFQSDETGMLLCLKTMTISRLTIE